MLQEKIIDELGSEMDSTANRLDFVQVILFMTLFLLSNITQFSWFKTHYLYISAEKGSNGDEEGKRQGPDHDDTILGGSIHYPLRFGLLHLGYRQHETNWKGDFQLGET